MAELDLEIHGKPGEVSAATFREAIYYAVSLLREFDAAVSGKRLGSLRWYIERLKSNGSLFITFHSKQRIYKTPKTLPPDVSSSVTSFLLSGFEDIEEKCVMPSYLSEFGLAKVGDLAHLIKKNGARGFRFGSQSKSVEVTSKTSENVGKLLPIQRTAIGSVEGNLEGVNLHGKPRVIVYHAVTKRAVTCLFEPDRFMDQVRNCLGRRVVIFGTLHKNINGDTLRVSMERLEIVDEKNRFALPGPTEGLQDPEFSKTPSTEAYLRSIRGR